MFNGHWTPGLLVPNVPKKHGGFFPEGALGVEVSFVKGKMAI